MIIIGDVHGNFKTLKTLVDKIPKSELDKGICLVGDLIDRGPSSKEVIQWCIDNKAHVVRGNHEDFMIRSGSDTLRAIVGEINPYDDQGALGDWFFNGADQTIGSYVNQDNYMFEVDTYLEHLDWIERLPLFLHFSDIKDSKGRTLLITHSSAHNVWKWPQHHRESHHKMFEEVLLWGRSKEIKPIEDVFNVFGHTIQENGPLIRDYFANIDTGCCKVNEKGTGYLTAIQFPEMVVYKQNNIDVGGGDNGERDG